MYMSSKMALKKEPHDPMVDPMVKVDHGVMGSWGHDLDHGVNYGVDVYRYIGI
jgi:hypothetical protein